MERAGGLMTDGFCHNRANTPLCGYAWGRGVMKHLGRYGAAGDDKNVILVAQISAFGCNGQQAPGH